MATQPVEAPGSEHDEVVPEDAAAPGVPSPDAPLTTAAAAVARAEEQLVSRGAVPPAWLGEEGERELASARVLVVADDLRREFDRVWEEYEKRCARLAVLVHRCRVLEMATELLGHTPREAALELRRGRDAARARAEEYEAGPWDCVQRIDDLVERSRRREVYAMAAKRWASVRRAAEDRLAHADSMVPEIAGTALLVATYVLARTALVALGMPGDGISSTASAVAGMVAVAAGLKAYLRQNRIRVIAVSRATSELRAARRAEAACLAAAEGGDEPPHESLNDHEQELVLRASRLAGRDSGDWAAHAAELASA